MAIGYTIIKKGVAGNMRIHIVDIALDATYASGGYAITAASCGLGTIHAVVALNSTTDGFLPVYDVANGKLQIYKGAATVTVTSGNAAFSEMATNDTLVSATTIVRCVIIGDMITGS